LWPHSDRSTWGIRPFRAISGGLLQKAILNQRLEKLHCDEMPLRSEAVLDADLRAVTARDCTKRIPAMPDAPLYLTIL
jgi:hypothetical protein